jgi:hypothetical protein
MGIILVDTSCEKHDVIDVDLTSNSNTESTTLKSTSSLGFTPIVELDLPQTIQEQIIAISILSQDVFDNPEIAQQFSSNPEAYLESIGYGDISLDLESAEVKTALALGDIDVRNAIEQKDLSLFINLLQNKGYLDLEPSIQIGNDLKNYLMTKYENDPFLKAHIEEFQNSEVYASPVIVALLYALVGVVSQAAAVYNVAVAINAALWINLESWTNVHHDSIDLQSSTISNPVLKIWGLETNQNDVYVINEIIESNLDEIVEMIVNLDVYKNSTNKITVDELRTILRKPITDKMLESGII